MKFLVIAHYANCSAEEPQDLVNSCWIVGEAMTETEAVDLAAKEIESHITESIEEQYDRSIDDFEEEEIQELKKEYHVSITNIRIPSDKMETVAELYRNSEDFYEDLRVKVIKL